MPLHPVHSAFDNFVNARSTGIDRLLGWSPARRTDRSAESASPAVHRRGLVSGFGAGAVDHSATRSRYLGPIVLPFLVSLNRLQARIRKDQNQPMRTVYRIGVLNERRTNRTENL